MQIIKQIVPNVNQDKLIYSAASSCFCTEACSDVAAGICSLEATCVSSWKCSDF